MVLVVVVEMVENHSVVVSLLLPKYAYYSGNLPEASVLVDISEAGTEIFSTKAGNSSIDTEHSSVVVVDLLIASTSAYLSPD